MGEQYFMTMEYVSGWNLEEFLDRHVETDQYIPADIAVFIVSRICRGLAYAHRKKDKDGRPLGIVHRDVNPKNIMIGQEGDVKLTDFGIAKALDLMYNHEGEVIAGKDEYLSPEQARCEVTDQRADLFGCGIVMAELMLGYNIFEDSVSENTIRNILEMEIPNFSEIRQDVDERLNDILHLALQRPREKRLSNSRANAYRTGRIYLRRWVWSNQWKIGNAYANDLFSRDGEQAAYRWQRKETPPILA